MFVMGIPTTRRAGQSPALIIIVNLEPDSGDRTGHIRVIIRSDAWDSSSQDWPATASSPWLQSGTEPMLYIKVKRHGTVLRTQPDLRGSPHQADNRSMGPSTLPEIRMDRGQPCR